MRWISYFILAYIALGLQAGIARAMDFHGTPPNLVLMAVIFIAMNAPRDAALLGCFILGAMQDLTSQGTMGLYSLSYGLVAMFVISAHQTVYREHPLTHFTLTLIGGVMTAVVIVVHGWIRPAGPREFAGEHLAAQHVGFMPLFYTAIYSAVLAPFVIGVLQKGKRAFQFQSAHRRGSSFRM
jgi:rod shape-determining protein MreD